MRPLLRHNRSKRGGRKRDNPGAKGKGKGKGTWVWMTAGYLLHRTAAERGTAFVPCLPARPVGRPAFSSRGPQSCARAPVRAAPVRAASSYT